MSLFIIIAQTFGLIILLLLLREKSIQITKLARYSSKYLRQPTSAIARRELIEIIRSLT